jgi:NADPH-dependent ferric siderophore reductase
MTTTPSIPDDPASRTSGRRPRRPPMGVEVTHVHALTPTMLTVTVTGPDLARFSLPQAAHHVKLFLPADGQDEPVIPAQDGATAADDPWPVIRTYTPRRFDPATLELDIEVLQHPGQGPAARWAAAAKPGDRAAVRGPGGGYAPDSSARAHLLAADDTGLPALCTVLEALPADAHVQVFAEVSDASAELDLPVTANTTVRWLHRGTAVPGQPLADAVAQADLLPETHAWIACESGAVRRIRGDLLTRLEGSALVTRGYWKLGESNHPDHDFGDDSPPSGAQR